MSTADLDRAVAHYRDLAPRYDHFTRRINDVRVRAVEALRLRPGEVVVDAGCGTGWCFSKLAAAVGRGGRLIGFDPSPDMLAMARTRLDPSSLPKAELIRATAEEVQLPAPADAILFSYTHDLIRSRRALANLLRQARPRARVAATGTKLYSPWLFPANWYLRYSHRGYITNFEGFDAPWTLLEELLEDFHVDTNGTTQHYIATGRVPAAARPQDA